MADWIPAKAVVLVGGEGTRLRPLTETIPKPLIPLVDRPFLSHLVSRLAGYGVQEVFLSSPYLEHTFAAFLRDARSEIEVTWVHEATPLGTGGAVANAAAGIDEPFFVLNGDILTDLDLAALARSHRENAASATIALTPVEDARPYGLVALGEGDRVLEFREKPEQPIPGEVNAGTYVLHPRALDGVATDRPVSIEREVFPGLIARGEPMFGFVDRGYWMDLGTPDKYLQATFDALDGRIAGLAYAAPYIDDAANVSLLSQLGRWVVAGPDVAIGDHAEVEDSVLLAGSVVEEGARVRRSILGPRSRVGREATVEGGVLAEGATVRPRTASDGARVPAGQVL
ncbi:MAG TPA: NDP-sugar synthase [Actinomycetota bacterium]|nr:NDP-sugar synthase [Actinomycetota bacterium]